MLVLATLCFYETDKNLCHQTLSLLLLLLLLQRGEWSCYIKMIPVDNYNTQLIWLCDTDLKVWLLVVMVMLTCMLLGLVTAVSHQQTLATMTIQTHQRLSNYIESVTMDDDLPLSVT